MIIQKKITSLCLLIVALRLSSQVSLSYYPLSSYVGISTNPDLRGWVDLRLLTNTFISNSAMELLPMVNIRKDSVVRCYVGAGIHFNVVYGLYSDNGYINGYLLAIGVRVSPFSAARNLSFAAEFSPYLNKTFTGATLRSNLGVAWRFKKRKSSKN